MPDDTGSLIAEFHSRIADIPATDWDACAGPSHPFVCHAFLKSLEDSGCADGDSGWQPQHVTLKTPEDHAVLAAMPLYIKTHSYGEYVFDHAWAAAFERAGGRYYPKLQASIPFTPVTGPRLLVRNPLDRPRLEPALLSAAMQLSEKVDLSSLHITFTETEQADRLAGLGLLRRTDQQFHWRNQGYDDFDDFLNALSSRKRKQIRKERRTVLGNGITIRHLRGAEITERHWDAFFRFYLDTGARKWGTPYLNRTFFSLIGDRMGDDILLFLCERDGQPVAGALNFIGADTLYGRYWGCVEDHPCLHFEACYYQAIDYAIAHGLNCVEAGAQGPHKLARGYEPVMTHSLHWIADPRFRAAVAQYLDHERREVETEVAWLAEQTPFKKS